MPRYRHLLFVLALVALCPSRSLSQDRLAPFYALPADGTWVEFDWTRLTAGNTEEKGTLRFSSVGRKEVKGVACRWIEIKVQARRGNKAKWQVRKLLVPEQAFRKGLPLEVIVVECFHSDDASGAVTRLSGKRIHDFLGMGLAGRKGAVQVIREKEKVPTALGTFPTRHVITAEKSGERIQTFHSWLTGDVPFGWTKLEIRDRLGNGPTRVVFTATITRKGLGAQSEVDESTAK